MERVHTSQTLVSTSTWRLSPEQHQHLTLNHTVFAFCNILLHLCPQNKSLSWLWIIVCRLVNKGHVFCYMISFQYSVFLLWNHKWWQELLQITQILPENIGTLGDTNYSFNIHIHLTVSDRFVYKHETLWALYHTIWYHQHAVSLCRMDDKSFWIDVGTVNTQHSILGMSSVWNCVSI